MYIYFVYIYIFRCMGLEWAWWFREINFASVQMVGTGIRFLFVCSVSIYGGGGVCCVFIYCPSLCSFIFLWAVFGQLKVALFKQLKVVCRLCVIYVICVCMSNDKSRPAILMGECWYRKFLVISTLWMVSLNWPKRSLGFCLMRQS